MKNRILSGIVTFFAMYAGVSCSDDTTLFERENDNLSCDCTEQVIKQVIMSDGEWTSDCTGTDWISVYPESGKGDGKYYSTVELRIQYNAGEAREGTVYFRHGGKDYPVTVSQAKCDFTFEEPYIDGLFTTGVESSANIVLPYIKANGTEEYEISAVISSETVSGLSVPATIFNSFVKGSGSLSIPVVGTPTGQGDVVFEILANGKPAGSCKASIYDEFGSKPTGLDVSWNFYEAGISPKGSDYDYSWSANSAHNPRSPLPSNAHKVLPTSGNTEAYLTAECAGASDYTFNPSIQINGLMLNDYFLAVIPVKNVKADTKIQVEASFGAAGSAAGVFSIEYSSNNAIWNLADGARDTTIFGQSGKVHYTVAASNTGATRKEYNKATDPGYKAYTFALDGIPPISDGYLYIRLRVSMDIRAKASSSAYKIKAGTWCDLKGLDIKLIKEE